MPRSLSDLHPNTALRVYSFGVSRLHDPNWTGIELYNELRQHVRDRREPNLLQRTLPDGVLFLLGMYAFADFLVKKTHFSSLRGEYAIWHLNTMVAFLRHHLPDVTSPSIAELQDEIDRVGELYDFDEGHYWDALKSAQWRREARRLRKAVVSELSIEHAFTGGLHNMPETSRSAPFTIEPFVRTSRT